MPNQNLQDAFLNSARKERRPVIIYLMSGVRLSGRVRGFDKYCVVFETNHQEQLIFKHAISTVVTTGRSPGREQESRHAGAHPAASGDGANPTNGQAVVGSPENPGPSVEPAALPDEPPY